MKRRYEKNVSDAKPAKIMSKEMNQLRATSGKKKTGLSKFCDSNYLFETHCQNDENKNVEEQYKSTVISEVCTV